jgi:hypothetical protein
VKFERKDHPVHVFQGLVKKQEREMSDAEIATWRSRAESAGVETPSGLVFRGKTESLSGMPAALSLLSILAE